MVQEGAGVDVECEGDTFAQAAPHCQVDYGSWLEGGPAKPALAERKNLAFMTGQSVILGRMMRLSFLFVTMMNALFQADHQAGHPPCHRANQRLA